MALAQTEKPEPFKKVVGKMGGAERKTEVAFFFGAPSPENIKKLREMSEGKRLDVILVGIEKDQNFLKMIRNDITVEEYLQEKNRDFVKMIGEYITVKEYLQNSLFKLYNPESDKTMFEFLKELYRNGTKVEQLDSEWQPIGEWIRGMKANDALVDRMAEGDFEKAVDVAVEDAKTSADQLKIADLARAKEIAEKIKTGEWSGNILVIGGSIHTLMKNTLKYQFREREDVTIKALYAREEDAEKVFGRGVSEVYDPMRVLTRVYMHGKEPVDKKELKERERLLGARFVILVEVSKTSKNSDVFEATKDVNQLSYEECKKIFDKIHSEKMNEERASEYLKTVLERKAKLYSV